MGLDREELAQMSKVDVRTVDRDSLVDIETVQIDRELPREQRVEDFVRQIGNPYCFRCGKAVVKVSFADTDVTLEERLENYLKNI